MYVITLIRHVMLISRRFLATSKYYCLRTILLCIDRYKLVGEKLNADLSLKDFKTIQNAGKSCPVVNGELALLFIKYSSKFLRIAVTGCLQF